MLNLRPVCLLAVLLPGLLAGLAAGPARAQRNGDVSGGRDRQPTAGEVQSRERAAGVTPPQEQQQSQTGAVDDIYKQLMDKEKPDGRGAASPSVPPLQPGPAR